MIFLGYMAEEIDGQIKALVLIRIEPLTEKVLVDELAALEGVTEAHFIYGPYDVYCIIDCPNYDALNDLVMYNIRGIQGIKSTTTCYLAE
jgi:DNA-binding Lrp family transcriptional regulator